MAIRWLSDNSLVRTFEGHQDFVTCVVVLADDKQIISGSGELIMHNVIDGSVRQKFKGHKDCIRSLALSVNSSTLVSGSDDGQVLVWDVLTAAVMRRLSHEDSVWGVAISFDNIIASCTIDN